MTYPQTRERRPVGIRAAQGLADDTTATRVAPATHADPVRLADVLDSLDFAPSMPPSEALARLDGTHALFVVSRGHEGRTRRRCYLNLPSAEAALARADERGHDAHIVLVRLAAVATITPAGGEGR